MAQNTKQTTQKPQFIIDLFRDAMLTDLKPNEFYQMTLKQLFIYLESYYIKKNEQSEFDILVAWYGALFNHGKMKYSDVVKSKPQTQEQQISAMDNIFNRFKAQNRIRKT